MIGGSGELKIVVDDFCSMRRQLGSQAAFLFKRPFIGEPISNLKHLSKTKTNLYRCCRRNSTCTRVEYRYSYSSFSFSFFSFSFSSSSSIILFISPFFLQFSIFLYHFSLSRSLTIFFLRLRAFSMVLEATLRRLESLFMSRESLTLSPTMADVIICRARIRSILSVPEGEEPGWRK